MIKSLRRKFIIIAMSSVFAVLAVVLGIINVVNYVNVIDNADSIISVLKEGDGEFGMGNFYHGGDINKNLSEETPYETRFFTVVLNGNGKAVLVNTLQIAAVTAEDAASYAEQLYAAGNAEGFYNSYRYGCSVYDNGNTMYIFVDCSKTLASFRTFLWTSIVVGIAGLLVVFVLVFVFSGWAMKPVAESYSKQKRFITDASHEIKTPLTIISADTDIMEMQDGGNEWTADIKDQVARLTSLTQKLVFLARMEEDGRKLNSVDFSISDAVEETVHPFNSVAMARGIRIESSIQPNLTYCGDESMIRQLVSLLLDNALKYSDGDAVWVVLESEGAKVRLTVKNRASYMDSGNCDVLFERFYRSDRSRNSETGGSGVGLSVAQAIVVAHKGKISAKKDGDYIVFTAVL